MYIFICHIHLIYMTLWCRVCVEIKGKGKSVPLQAWSGPEGSRKLRLPDFMITTQEGGKVVSLTHRPGVAQRVPGS